VVVSRLDTATGAWETARDVELPPDPRLWGEGLTQDTPTDAMEAHFRRVLEDPNVPAVELGGVETDLLRVECDREHPVWPNHGETQGNVYQVPFGLFNPLRAIGEPAGSPAPQAAYLPTLRAGAIAPRAPRGMTCRQVGESIRFEGRHLSVGFALRRPLLLHLGWDTLGRSLARENRLAVRRPARTDANHGTNGPLTVTPWGNFGAHFWTGRIEVRGNRVSYRGLRAAPGLHVDATFHIEPRRLVLELTQWADEPTPVLESEAWRFVWCLARGMTGVAGTPTQAAGRSGDLRWPALFAGDGPGCLALQLLHGDPEQVRLQAESYRSSNEVTAGIALGPRPAPGGCAVVPARRIHATVELAVENLQPAAGRKARRPGLGVQRHWASTFSCYRPEWGGFSNHAASVNCLVNQNAQLEVAAFTGRPRCGWDPLDAARFSVGRGLMDGSGYGYWRNLYLDADPTLVAAAGRVYQVSGDLAWVRSVEPGLVAAVERLLGTIGEQGLAVCRDLSGNSGSHRWSSNAWDIVGFGHLDSYVNAWTYRALRSAAAMLAAVGRPERAARARQGATRIRAAFAAQFVNPATGWVAGWRSRDGQLHDYAMLWANGPACAFGLLEPAAARRALRGLERLRDQLGLRSARCGLPFSLWPLDPADHMMPVFPGFLWTEPTFELFTDGSMSPGAVTYYLRALSTYGFKDRARRMARDLDAGFADGLFSGGAGRSMGEGNEFLSWEGLASGYEGTFGPTMGALYGVAIEQGLFTPPDPEWWPQGG
jgi:hypothetical protein